MLVRRIKNNSELLDCIDAHLSQHSPDEIPGFMYDVQFSRKSILRLYSRSAFFRVLEHKGEVAAWMAASVVEPFPFSPKKALYVNMLGSKLRGISGVRSVILLHDSAVEFAKGLPVSAVISTSVSKDAATYFRILERIDFEICGSVAIHTV